MMDLSNIFVGTGLADDADCLLIYLFLMGLHVCAYARKMRTKDSVMANSMQLQQHQIRDKSIPSQRS